MEVVVSTQLGCTHPQGHEANKKKNSNYVTDKTIAAKEAVAVAERKKKIKKTIVPIVTAFLVISLIVGAVFAIGVPLGMLDYNPEATGYFIELMSAESRKVLLPEYYEINLKGKVARDQESAEMLDLIFANRIYDLGQIYDPGNFSNTLIYMTMTKDRDVASKWASNQKMINKTLDRMLEKFQ